MKQVQKSSSNLTSTNEWRPGRCLRSSTNECIRALLTPQMTWSTPTHRYVGLIPPVDNPPPSELTIICHRQRNNISRWSILGRLSNLLKRNTLSMRSECGLYSWRWRITTGSIIWECPLKAFLLIRSFKILLLCLNSLKRANRFSST